MYLNPLMIFRGITSYIPGMYKLSVGWTGGTNSSKYCYTVWLRHLIYANKYSQFKVPNKVAEIGPGDSIGIGLAALISGVNEYYAFDVVEYFNTERNLKIFDELVKLFKERQKLSDEKEFPNVKPYLDSYEFPSDIITEEHLREALNPDRLKHIKDAIINLNDPKGKIKIYYSPKWYDQSIIKEHTMDMIFSQAVMEHVDDLESAYKSMYGWLAPMGIMSHEIDFKCHGLAFKWNGQWSYSDNIWKILRGRLPYLINREPHTTHINLIKNNNFKIVIDLVTIDKKGIKRKSLNSKFGNLSDDDLVICDAFIMALK